MKMKVILAVLLIMLLISNIYASGITTCNKVTIADDDTFIFQPEDINLQDDAFQSITGDLVSHFTEWWYFDAIFDNKYSIQLAIRIIGSFDKIISGISRLDIYKEGALVYHKQQTHQKKDLILSTTEPDIKINNKQVIKGYMDQQTQEWIYDLSFDMGDASADLHLIGVTKGYKGNVPGSVWVVVFPRADITGNIKLNGETITVRGTAYHDHNYKATAEMVSNYGWYWGRIYSKDYTINWAEILKTNKDGSSLLVISKTNGEYINILPEDIKVTAEDFKKTNSHYIPMKFNITIKTEDISLSVELIPADIHYCKVKSLVHYWRYHMECEGQITVNSQIEEIDEISITEFLKFRPPDTATHSKPTTHPAFTNILAKLLDHFPLFQQLLQKLPALQ